jgi:hypothetical protein
VSLFLHVVVYAAVIIVGWFVLALGVALILCRAIRTADRVEGGGVGDRPTLVSDFYSAPHDIGKSISEMKP